MRWGEVLNILLGYFPNLVRESEYRYCVTRECGGRVFTIFFTFMTEGGGVYNILSCYCLFPLLGANLFLTVKYRDGGMLIDVMNGYFKLVDSFLGL